jgi:hypothetical protein
MPKIITRAEAKALGLKRYFTGKPCKRGHVCERLVSNRACLECDCERILERYAANPEKYREIARRRRTADPEYGREKQQRDVDPEKRREQQRKWQRKWRAALPKNLLELERQRQRQWKADNRELNRWMAREFEAVRRAMIRSLRKLGVIEKGDTRRQQIAILKAALQVGLISKEDVQK